jgi:transposase InsO family protein
MTSRATISELDGLFAAYGLPEVIVSDNGKPFTSAEFVNFCKERGITHLKSPPYNPQSNGQVERFVDVFKRNVLKFKPGRGMQQAIQKLVFGYRSTPCTALPNNATPANMFLGRHLRTPLSLLHPSLHDVCYKDDKRDQSVHTDKRGSNKKNKMEHDSQTPNFTRDSNVRSISSTCYRRSVQTPLREFLPSDAVYARIAQQGKWKWMPATVLRREGSVIYTVLACGTSHRLHVRRLRRRDASVQEEECYPLAFDLYGDDEQRTPPALNQNAPRHVHFADPLEEVPMPAPPMPRSIQRQPIIRRSTRIPKPRLVLQVEPPKKRYSAEPPTSNLGGEV